MSYCFLLASLMLSNAAAPSGPVREAWVRRYHGPGYGDDRPSAIAIDSAGNSYVTGTSFGSPRSYSEYATLKYDSEGNQLWLARYHYPLYAGDEAKALAVDADGKFTSQETSVSKPVLRALAPRRSTARSSTTPRANYFGQLNIIRQTMKTMLSRSPSTQLEMFT